MLAWLERHQYLVLACACFVLAAGLVAPRLAGDGPTPVVFREGSGLPAGTPIRVYIAGAVQTPGVYDLREGDRVTEALAAAGGPSDAADLDQLNLARRVRDEEQLLVPSRTVPAAKVEPLPPGVKLDLNAATAAQLDQLPGIGEAYSRHIVDSRQVDGPFKTPQDLVDRHVLPQATFNMIRDLVRVGP